MDDSFLRCCVPRSLVPSYMHLDTNTTAYSHDQLIHACRRLRSSLAKNQSSPFYGGGRFSLWALASHGFSAAEFRSHCFRPTHPFRYVSVRFAFQSLIKRAGVGWGHGKRFQAVSQQTRSVRLRLFFFSFVLSLSGGGRELADPLSRLCFWRQFRVVG